VSWTLGSIIKDADKLSPAKYEIQRDMSNETYIAVMIVLGIVLLIGVAFLVVAYRKLR